MKAVNNYIIVEKIKKEPKKVDGVQYKDTLYQVIRDIDVVLMD